MLVEGTWWENEAQSTYKDMVDAMGDSYSQQNRKFAIMPLPKVDANELGVNTLCENS